MGVLLHMTNLALTNPMTQPSPSERQKMNKMYLVIGDWSSDGHSKSEKILVEVNYNVKTVQDAYKKSCKLTGISFNHNDDFTGKNYNYREARRYHIASEYEQGMELSEEVMEILDEHQIDYQRILEYWDGDVKGFVELWFEFTRLSLPGLQWKFPDVKDEIPCINGYWNDNLNVQFGYGLYYA